MTRTIRVGCVQLNGGQDMAANLARTEALIREAHAKGARFIATPENTPLMEHRADISRAAAEPTAGHPAVKLFASLARELGAYLLLGSHAARGHGERLHNRSVLFDDRGAIVASYDKIHMFDVELSDGATYRESSNFQPGTDAVVADAPFGQLGLTVCYDMRFAYLYRLLAQAGAEILTVPSAFTQVTGEAHWHVLLRARAIETGSYVIAAAQCGSHSGNRRTFGHSLIVDPWGRVLEDGGTEEGVIVADLDLAKVTEARTRIPALKHDWPVKLAGISKANFAASR
ncbi:MAG: carbon-nitrogen hydrolase family protein [Alphaproteobacteria bacterium]|nr:carbon-nitrogen hydrolase family protein [Alphaproteobacteria bacterium]